MERSGSSRKTVAYWFGAVTVRAMDCVCVTLPEIAVTVRV
jgi:hypothetical protein